jgi:hypothetical protein
LPAPTDGHNWVGALFSQSALMQVYWKLEMKSCLQIPGDRTSYKLPLVRLDSLGSLGYDVRDIVDAFEVVVGNAKASQYSAFWNHDAKGVVTIEQKPNSSLLARTTAIEGRKLKSASAVWAPAGTILLVSRLWPITHKVLAVGLNRRSLGNTWWAFNDAGLTDEERKSLLLWLNSSFGLLMYFGHRVTTRGAWMQMKKPGWASTFVLNVKDLTPSAKRNMASAYDQLAGKALMPLADLDKDDIRAAIDKVICGALKLPSIELIRELLANEPGLSGNATEDVEAESEDELGTDD